MFVSQPTMKSCDAPFRAWTGHRAATLFVNSVLLMTVLYCFLQYWRKGCVLSGVCCSSLIWRLLFFGACIPHKANFVQMCSQVLGVGCVRQQFCSIVSVSTCLFSKYRTTYRCSQWWLYGLHHKFGNSTSLKAGWSWVQTLSGWGADAQVGQRETGWRVKDRVSLATSSLPSLLFFCSVSPL